MVRLNRTHEKSTRVARFVSLQRIYQALCYWVFFFRRQGPRYGDKALLRLCYAFKSNSTLRMNIAPSEDLKVSEAILIKDQLGDPIDNILHLTFRYLYKYTCPTHLSKSHCKTSFSKCSPTATNLPSPASHPLTPSKANTS